MSNSGVQTSAPPAWLSLLRLMRFPTVFTAFGDILCGSALAVGQAPFVPEIIPLLLASACLYLSGMVFNDVFDYEADVQTRANRPLPNGELSLSFAIYFGSALMMTGLLFAGLTWPARLGLGLILASLILFYDVVLKRTPLAPLVMGCCRGMNLILGASLVANFTILQFTPVGWTALGMTLYITGVTVFARQEAVQSPRLMLSVGLGLIHAGFLILATTLFWLGSYESCLLAILFLAFIGFRINRKALPAIQSGSPTMVQAAIRTMLLSLLMIHSTMIYGVLGTNGIPFALLTLSLFIPARLMARAIAIT